MAKVSIPVEAGQTVRLNTIPSTALFSREGVDLVITDGDSITVYSGFFAQGEGNPLPNLVLPDGVEVAGEAFLRSLDSEMDLATAAGPSSSSTASSGGSGEYADDAGALLGGVERLGSLGTSQWSTGRESGETLSALGPIPAADPAATEPVQPPVVVESTFHTRGVLGGTAESVRVLLVDEDGAPILGVNPADINFDFADDTYFTNARYDPQSGALMVDLTDKGKEALADGIQFDDKLTVTVNGEEYSIYFSSPSDSGGGYKTGDHNFGNGDSPLAEWYAYEGVQQGDVTLNAKFAEIAIESSAAAFIGGNGDGEEDPCTKGLVVGAIDSNLAANDSGLIRISADNEGSGARSVVGYLDDSAGKKTITGGTVEISAVSDEKNAPDEGWNSTTVGLLSHNGGVDINAQNVSISAEASLSTGSSDWWGSSVYTAGVKTGNASRILEREGQDWEPAHGGLAITGKADAENTVSISGSLIADGVGADKWASGSAYGVHASNTDFSLTGGAKDDTFIIEAAISGAGGAGNGNFEAYGLVADNGDGDTDYEGGVVIDGGDGIDTLRISAIVDVGHMQGRATGIAGLGHTVHIKDVEDIEVTAKSSTPGEHNATGIYAHGDGNGNGEVIISNADNDMKLTVNSSGVGIEAYGPMLIDAGKNLDMTVNADMTGISSSSWRDAGTQIQAAEDLKLAINVDKQHQEAYYDQAIGIEGSGVTITSGGNLDMQVNVKTVSGDAYGIRTESGTNKIESNGTLDVTVHAAASGGGKANAIYTGGDDHNNPRAAELSLTSKNTDASKGDTIDLKGDVVAGIMGTNTIQTGAGSDTFLLDGDLVAGMRYGYTGGYADFYGENTLKTGQGDDTVTITGSVHTKGATNTIDTGVGDDVINLGSLDAESIVKHTIDSRYYSGKWVYTHTYEDIQGVNNVIAGAGDDTLTVANGVNANGGINKIDMGAGNDEVIIHDGLNASTQSNTYGIDYYDKPEVTREVGGRNEIDMGAGNDKLIVNGGVNSTGDGENHIDMGLGNDTLQIHGDLITETANSLITVDMGAGNDSLILDGSILGDNAKIDGGADDDVLIYRYTGTSPADMEGLLSLIGKVENVESLVIDMSGNSTNDQLSLDDILGLHGQGFDSIYIKGDTADQVNTDGWTSTGNSADGYIEYRNDSGDQSIFIEQQIMSVSGG